MPTIGIHEIHTIPIKIISKNDQIQIEKLVNEILKMKRSNQSTVAIEIEIDMLVYKIYELSYNEVKVIDKNFGMSEDEV